MFGVWGLEVRGSGSLGVRCLGVWGLGFRVRMDLAVVGLIGN